MDIQKEREAFEAWYCRNHTGLKQSDLAKFRTLSGYCFSDSLKINISWEAWQAAKAQAVPEWVSVDDKLPAIGVYVMVFLEKQGHNPTTYNFCQYTKFGFHLSNVTHWMPLPDAPKTQEQKG